MFSWGVLAAPRGLWDLCSPTRDQTQTLAVKAPSPDHWTAREFPCCSLVTNTSKAPVALGHLLRRGHGSRLCPLFPSQGSSSLRILPHCIPVGPRNGGTDSCRLGFPGTHDSWFPAGFSQWEALVEMGVQEEERSQGISPLHLLHGSHVTGLDRAQLLLSDPSSSHPSVPNPGRNHG